MKRGFSTIELLVAMAIGILIMSAVVLVSFGNQSSLVSSATNADAISVAKGEIENEQALGRQDFNLVNSTTSTETRDGITYSITTTVTLLSDYLTKQVITVVSWVGEHGQTLTTTLSTLVTNLDNVNSPNVCNSALTNVEGWKTPANTDFDFQQLLYGNNANGLSLSSVYAFYKKLYVTASSPPSNPGDSETFFVLDITDPAVSPSFKGSVDNNTSSDDGINDVTMASTSNKIYAYVANAHATDLWSCTQSANCSEFQVIEATNAAAPQVKYSFKMATSSAPFVYGNHPSASGQATGKSVFYYNGYLYVGLNTTQNGPGFHIFDVGAGTYGGTPIAPVYVGSWPTPSLTFGSSGAPINSIVVKGKYAYLAHPDGLVGALAEEMTVLDISTPSSPTRVTGYNNSVGAANAAGHGLMALGNILYFGRTASNSSGSADAIPEFYVLNNPDPGTTQPTLLGGISLATNESVNSLVVRDYLAFLLTTTQFKVLNISNLGSISTWGTLALPGNGGSAFDCEGDRFFVINDVQKDHVSVVTAAPPIDFTLSNSGNIAVNPGSSGNTTITKTNVVYPRAVTLSVSGLPAGASATFTNNPCTPTCNSVLTISTTVATAPGTYAVTVTGSPNGTSNPSTTFNLVVNSFSYSLANTGNITVAPGSAGNTTISRTFVSGVTSAVTLSASGLPSGATVTFTNNPCSPSCNSTLTISTTALTPVGTYPITVTGSPNGTTNPSTTFNLVVKSFDYSLSNNGNITVVKGASGSNTITRSLTFAPTQGVTLAASGLPTGATAVFTNNGCSPNCSGLLTITTSGTTDPGVYVISVSGTPSGFSSAVTGFNLIVNKATPVVTLTLHDAAHGTISSVSAGSIVHGSASMSGGLSPAGTVSFNYYANGTCTGAATNAGTIAIAAGIAHPSNASSPLNAGTYSWRATYNGDADNNSVTSACKVLTVTKLTPTIITTIKNSAGFTVTAVPAGTVVHDEATVSGAIGTPTGTVTFTISTNKTNCGNPTQGAGTGTLNGSGIAQSNTFTTANGKNNSYSASYSGDTNYNAITAVCEPLTVN